MASILTNSIIYLIQNYFVRNISKSHQIFVSMKDPRNFVHIGAYMNLAIPSILLISMEWGAFEIIVLMTGSTGINILSVHVICL